MQRLFIYLVALIFISCSQTFIEETQEVERIDTEVSYNTMSEGILLGWKNQPDYARIEVLRGEAPGTLVVFNNKLVQEQWLDTENIPGQVYYYQLKAYNSRDRQIGQSVIVKGFRSYRSINNIESPRDPIASKDEYPNKIEIFWVGDPVDRFRVYRECSSAKGVKLKLLSEIGFDSLEEMAYIDEDVLAGAEYLYRIASVGQDENGAVVEKFTDSFTGSTLDAPSGLTASKKDELAPGRITLSWTEDASVSSYKVYRSDTEDGTYEMIAPYAVGNSYIDSGIPDLEGELKDGQYTYPSYYYKIKSIKRGVESGYSAVAEGQAIDPNDYLPATTLELVLNKSAYPYVLELEWAVQPNTSYQLSRIDEHGATNIIEAQTTVGTKQLSNEPFDTQWKYVVRAVNQEAGGLLGEPAVKDYHSVTPAPPILNLVTKGARIYQTNITTPNTETHIYWNEKNGRGRHMESMTGIVSDEWVVTSEVGFINLAWEPQVVEETIGYYTVYRRKKGDEVFEKVYDNITQTTLKDVLTSEQLTGTGSGGSFAYPLYEYQITASYGGGESMPSAVLEGSAINPADILPAPAFVSVPFHWADGTGFGQWNSFIGLPRAQSFKKGAKSPIGFDQITDKWVTYNYMVLSWGDVNNAPTYRVRHSVGPTFVENGEDKTSWYTHGGINRRNHLWINNEITSEAMTHMYQTLDLATYIVDIASFNVAPINAHAGNLIGDERGIIFREPSSAPTYY